MPSEINILFEDEYLVAVEKPAELPVHRGRRPGADDLQTLIQEQLGRELVLFHRLDIDTTGVVLLGKDRSINADMAAIFAEKRIRKTYWAVVAGRWQPEWTRLETRIDEGSVRRYRNVVVGGREAISTFHLMSAGDEKSWVEVLPKTGRTHQVRLHCLALGCPVLGDRMYGEPGPAPIALHARRIDFRHPKTKQAVRVTANPPAYWREVWLAGLDLTPDQLALF